MSKPDNPKAFPYGKDTYMTFGGDWQGHPGMTLRDYFAGQALIGLLADGRATEASVRKLPDVCYALADQLLEARQKGGDS